MIRLALIAALVLLIGAGQALACRVLLNRHFLSDEKTGFAFEWRFVPAHPKVGEFFAIELTFCRHVPASADELRIDAIMPAHRHGMNFQPKIAAIGSGIYRADGLMFHMPGTWQLIFEQRMSGGTARVTADVEIE